MRIQEIIPPANRLAARRIWEHPDAVRHPPPHPAPQAVDADVKEAARTLVGWLQSLEHARFTIYSTGYRPGLIGDVRDGNLRPADLEQRLLEPTATGFEIDVEILDQHPRWLSVVYPRGGGPAKRVIRWRSAPRSEPGRPWIYGLDPERLRRTVTTIGDLVAAASNLDRR